MTQPYPYINKESASQMHDQLINEYGMKYPEVSNCDWIAKKLGMQDGSVHVVWGNNQDIGSYKAPGAGAAILKRVEQAKQHNLDIKNGEESMISESPINEIEVVICSEGNHSQAAALATAHFADKLAEELNEVSGLSIKGTAFLPENADEVKRDKTIKQGTSKETGSKHVELKMVEGHTFDFASDAAKEYMLNNGDDKNRGSDDDITVSIDNGVMKIFIPPFDLPDIVLGAATSGKNIKMQLEKEDKIPGVIATGTGGGGLVAGLKRFFNDSNIMIQGVQPANFPGVIGALINGGTPVRVRDAEEEGYPLYVGGAMIFEGGKVPCKMLHDDKAAMGSVHPDQTVFAARDFWDNDQPTELAGALSYAWALQNKDQYENEISPDKPLVVFNTGSNISLEKWAFNNGFIDEKYKDQLDGKQYLHKLLKFAEERGENKSDITAAYTRGQKVGMEHKVPGAAQKNFFPDFPQSKLPFYDPERWEESFNSLKTQINKEVNVMDIGKYITTGMSHVGRQAQRGTETEISR